MKYVAKQINLDEANMNILKDINPVHRDTVINMSIRLFTQTDVFKMYFNNNSDVSVEADVPVQVQPSIQPQVQNTQAATPPEPSVMVASWDDF